MGAIVLANDRLYHDSLCLGCSFESTLLRKNLSFAKTNKSISCSGDIDQILPAIVANNDTIETVCPRSESANYKLLSAFDAFTESQPVVRTSYQEPDA